MKKRLQAGGVSGTVEQEIVRTNQDGSGRSTSDAKSDTAMGTESKQKEDVEDIV